MSSTIVQHLNKKETSSIAASAFATTEKTLEVPPKGQIYKTISTYVEDAGNMEIPVGKSRVNENAILEKEDGTTITMVNPKAYKILKAYQTRRNEMKLKAEKSNAGISRE